MDSRYAGRFAGEIRFGRPAREHDGLKFRIDVHPVRSQFWCCECKGDLSPTIKAYELVSRLHCFGGGSICELKRIDNLIYTALLYCVIFSENYPPCKCITTVTVIIDNFLILDRGIPITGSLMSHLHIAMPLIVTD